jgi:hypothetical protein
VPARTEVTAAKRVARKVMVRSGYAPAGVRDALLKVSLVTELREMSNPAASSVRVVGHMRRRL